jgi:hypothetical protein
VQNALDRNDLSWRIFLFLTLFKNYFKKFFYISNTFGRSPREEAAFQLYRSLDQGAASARRILFSSPL